MKDSNFPSQSNVNLIRDASFSTSEFQYKTPGIPSNYSGHKLPTIYEEDGP